MRMGLAGAISFYHVEGFPVKVRFKKVLEVGLLLTLFASVNSAQVSFPTVQTSGNRRFIEHTGKEKTLQGQLLAARTEAQRFLKQVNHIPMSSVGDNVGRSTWVQMAQPTDGLQHTLRARLPTA